MSTLAGRSLATAPNGVETIFVCMPPIVLMHASAVLSVPISTLKRGHLSGARWDFYLQTEMLARLSACALGFVRHRFLARGGTGKIGGSSRWHFKSYRGWLAAHQLMENSSRTSRPKV